MSNYFGQLETLTINLSPYLKPFYPFIENVGHVEIGLLATRKYVHAALSKILLAKWALSNFHPQTLFIKSFFF